MKSVIITLLLAAGIIASVPASARNEYKIVPDQTENISMDVSGAKSAKIALDSSLACIRITDGSEKQISGTLKYNVMELKPVSTCKLSDEKARLSVKDPQGNINIKGNVSETWDINLPPSIPSDISICQSVGSDELNFHKINLSKLNICTSTGNVEADFSGEHKLLEKVGISTSTGGVKAVFAGAYDKIRSIKIESSTGGVDLDLSGHWDCGAKISVRSSTGNIYVILPKDVAVCVHASSSTGNVSCDGLRKDGDRYVSSNLDNAKITLQIDAETSTGNVNLEAKQ